MYVQKNLSLCIQGVVFWKCPLIQQSFTILPPMSTNWDGHDFYVIYSAYLLMTLIKNYCAVQSIVHLKPARSLLFVDQSMANRIKCLWFQPISSVSTTLLPLLRTYSFNFFHWLFTLCVVTYWIILFSKIWLMWFFWSLICNWSRKYLFLVP